MPAADLIGSTSVVNTLNGSKRYLHQFLVHPLTMTVLLCASLLRTRWCGLHVLDESIRCLGTLRRPLPNSHSIPLSLHIPRLTLLWRGLSGWSARRVLQQCGGKDPRYIFARATWPSNELYVASQHPAIASVFIDWEKDFRSCGSPSCRRIGQCRRR